MAEDIVVTDNVSVTLLEERLLCVRMRYSQVKSAAWALLRLAFFTPDVRGRGILAIIRDDLTGLTVVAPEDAAQAFVEASGRGVAEASSTCWRAFQIHMGAGAEVPGVIGLISQVLAQRNISILNLSTYDSDVVLVKETHVEFAAECFKLAFLEPESVRPAKPDLSRVDSGGKIEYADGVDVLPMQLNVVRLRKEMFPECTSVLTRLLLFEDTVWGDDGCGAGGSGGALGATSAPSGSMPVHRSMPVHAARVNRAPEAMTVAAAPTRPAAAASDTGAGGGAGAGASVGSGSASGSGAPVKSGAEGAGAGAGGGATDGSDGAGKPSPRGHPSDVDVESLARHTFWCYFETSDEISLILDDCGVRLFPDMALVHDPMKWTAIRLRSRPIPFHVTGVVNQMSAPLARLEIPILNVSTFHHNYSLVEETNTEDSATALQHATVGKQLVFLGSSSDTIAT